MYIEREIKDMSGLMDDLRDAFGYLDGAVSPDHSKAIEYVIEEWDEYTKPCMEECAAKLEATD